MPGGVEREIQSLSQMKVSILRAENSSLGAIECKAGVSGLHVGLPIKVCTMHLNGLFLNSAVRGSFKEKIFCAVEIEFLTIGNYIDRRKWF